MQKMRFKKVVKICTLQKDIRFFLFLFIKLKIEHSF
jgi:hypothetical protein